MNKKLICLLSFAVSILVILCSGTAEATFASMNPEISDKSSMDTIDMMFNDRSRDYKNYLSNLGELAETNAAIKIEGSSYLKKTDTNAEPLSNYKNMSNVLAWTDSSGYVDWEAVVEVEGFYSVGIEYYPIEGKNRPIEIAFAIDGSVPFNEAATIGLPRIWMDSGKILKDRNGNDYSPRQVQKMMWVEQELKNSSGQLDDPYLFYFTKGIHNIRVYSLQEPFILGRINLNGYHKTLPYSEYVSKFDNSLLQHDEIIKIEAETPTYKSDDSLRASNDRSDPFIFPSSSAKIRLNVLSWEKPSQWIEWSTIVPKDGFYTLTFRYQQSSIKGFFTSRRLFIDGEMPFDEAKSIRFQYSEKYQSFSFSDSGNRPYRIYLTKGNHTIRLEAVLGELSNTISQLDEAIFDLNTMYRKIIMITGTQPDIYRDYKLEKEVPGLLQVLKSNAARLRKEYEFIIQSTGNTGNDAYILDVLARQLDGLVEQPDSIPDRLDAFKSNIGSLAAWILDIKRQPIDLDCIYLSSADAQLPRMTATYFEKIQYEIAMFFSSFFEDYNSLQTASDKKSITLWLSTGRDQAQVLRTMIDDMFTPDQGIAVNLKLVNASMIQAFLSNAGPDAAIMQGRGQPVNLAARGALIDLTQFDDFDNISERFQKNALIPYIYDNGCFGIPDSQYFYMMFYRKDIFSELELEPPKTWDELYAIIPVIQRKNMDIGLPYAAIDAWGMIDAGMGSRNIFPSLLIQGDGDFYNSSLTSTALNSDAAETAFTRWTEFYKLYSLPLTYDFYNRFRTGEMPIAIAPYTEFNRLTAAAPEIKNLWEMIPIPGTLRKDGTIDITQGGAGTASVILSNTSNKEAAWEFIKWWTSQQAQLRYALDIESVIGEIGRYPTSNIEALKSIPWDSNTLDSLLEQWSNVKEIPEVVGGYYLMIGIENAFIEAVYESRNPREALSIWNRKINDEILRKRKEFNLE